MPPTRIPQPQDFDSLKPQKLHVSTHYPSPPESTTSILLLFHGLGDTNSPFLSFASNLSLPGVLAISVRGISPLPPSLLGLPLDSGGPTDNFHWGDDLKLDARTGEIDMDPGYEKVWELVMDRLVGEVLIRKCGWETADVMLFGFGQGGGVALGLGSLVRTWDGPKVEEVKEGEEEEEQVKEGVAGDEEKKKNEKAFKGIVSIGGALPPSMIPSVSAREKAKTPVLVLHGSKSEYVGEDEVDLIQREFENVKVVEWKRPDDGMPRSREEVLPMMEFFAERLKSGWP
ncbi:Alpha/Beta hydrolase protein [Pseudoneurospora amorphoporcata]|uniref:Alpha/Beta hydrolase protein n=1 Tax=Pseudoneurospora amorphoporcata TaxID=241081 RepID=A0AAN6NRR6_9PEZI|nr:Alpha/Beta hydrolase protein [Pseudoneurospora amorphoporcata]